MNKRLEKFENDQNIQNFIQEYFNLCEKYNLCIGVAEPNSEKEDLMLYQLSDYDYYDDLLDDNGNPIPIYKGFFMTGIIYNYLRHPGFLN